MSQSSPLSAARDRALALRAGGDPAGARRLLAETIETARPHLGEDHPDVLGTAHLLARLHREADDPTGARRVLEEAFAAGERRWGHADALMLAIAFDLASVAEELGNRHEARRNYQRVANSGPGVLGNDHPAVRAARAYLGLDVPAAPDARTAASAAGGTPPDHGGIWSTPPTPAPPPLPPAVSPVPPAAGALLPPFGPTAGPDLPTTPMPAVPAPRRPQDAAPVPANPSPPPSPPQPGPAPAPQSTPPPAPQFTPPPAPQPGPPPAPVSPPTPHTRTAQPPAAPTQPSVPHPRTPPTQQSPRPAPAPAPAPADEQTRPVPAQHWDEPTVRVRQIGNTDDLRPLDASAGGLPVSPPSADNPVGIMPVSAPPDHPISGAPYGQSAGGTPYPTPVSEPPTSGPPHLSSPVSAPPNVPSPTSAGPTAGTPAAGELPAVSPAPVAGSGAPTMDGPGEFFSSPPTQATRPAAPEPDRPITQRLLVVLVAVAVLVLAAVLAGAAVLALNVAQGRTTPVPAAPSTAPAATPEQPFAPPADLELRDDGTSVTVTWSDPSGGVVPFVVAGGRSGSQLGAMATVDPGQTSWTVNGLNPRVDYCFTVLAVYSTESYATSGQVCTDRGAGPSPG